MKFLSNKLLTAFICLMAFFNGIYSYGQGIDNFWVFGQNCGLDFSGGTPVAFNSTDGGLGNNAWEGCASISSEDGDLLFFTNGHVIWNREYDIMSNGNNIIPSGIMVSSTTQATLIVQVPGSNSLFYVFSLEEQSLEGKLYYTLVDMTLNSGKGAVVEDKKGIQFDTDLTEKMTIAPGPCGKLWVVVRARSTNQYKSYGITEEGLDMTPVLSTVGNGTLDSYLMGTLKCSNDGKKMAAALHPPVSLVSTVELYEFNKNTGMLSNASTIAEQETTTGSDVGKFYAVCFSPDDSKLYLDTHFPNKLYQLNIDLPSVEEIIESKVLLADMGTNVIGDMRKGPDGKIYIAAFEKSYLHAINLPNSEGETCGFSENAVTLPSDLTLRCWVGLPNSNLSPSSGTEFDTVTSCSSIVACNNVTLSASSDLGPYLWNTGETTKEITISTPGLFYVCSKAECSMMIDSFNVSFTALPISLLDKSLNAVCEGEILTMSVLPTVSEHFSLLWNTGSTQRSINVDQAGIYWVTASLSPCESVDSILVSFEDCNCRIELPTIFSPNGDGINDVFKPVGTAACSEIENCNINVYNRWGQHLYSGNPFNVGWDGCYMNIPVEIGTYFYIFTYMDRYNTLQTKKGDITVVR